MKKKTNPLNTFHTYTKMKARGAKNSEIAAKLGISLPTFYNHMKQVRAKETDVKLVEMPFTAKEWNQPEGDSESIDPLTRPLLKFMLQNDRIRAVLAEELMKHILGL